MFTPIWKMLCEPARLRRIGESLKNDQPAAREIEQMRSEIARLQGREKRVLEAFEDGDYDRATKNAKLAELHARMARIEVELRAMNRIASIAPVNVVERACAAITDVSAPTTFEGRRGVLEALLDLRVVLDGKNVEITGKVPLRRKLRANQRIFSSVLIARRSSIAR